MTVTATIIIAVVAALLAAALTFFIMYTTHRSKFEEQDKLYQALTASEAQEHHEEILGARLALNTKEQELESMKQILAEKEINFQRMNAETKKSYETTINALKDSQDRQITELKESQQKQISELKSSQDKQIAELKAAQDKQLADMKEAQEVQLKALTDRMTADTEKILRQREEELAKENKSGMDEILTPLKESIKEMKEAMSRNAEAHIQKNTELSKQLEQAVKEMKEKTSDIGTKADELATALSGKPKIQGCFGESFLEDILSREGLEPDKHYSREAANDDHSRPDFVFHFKEGTEQKDLIVDSKVSLTAFIRYMNAEDETTRQVALADHVASIRKHIEELARKEYARKVEDKKRFADYVLMFMPYDTAFRIAVDAEPLLWQEAYGKGVLITTEQTIVPFLKIMKLTWNKYQHDANMAEIEKAATNMIDRVGAFYDSYKDLGKKLSAVCREYNTGIVKLQDRGLSITTAAQQVMKFGIKRSKGKELEVPKEKVTLDSSEEGVIDFGSF
ncbi:MAG: DNA recombination protein RmuC [Bacteroidales bacterium]|nr:DNA recombination protein RmuC [Bacteroidales bacterium]